MPNPTLGNVWSYVTGFADAPWRLTHQQQIFKRRSGITNIASSTKLERESACLPWHQAQCCRAHSIRVAGRRGVASPARPWFPERINQHPAKTKVQLLSHRWRLKAAWLSTGRASDQCFSALAISGETLNSLSVRPPDHRCYNQSTCATECTWISRDRCKAFYDEHIVPGSQSRCSLRRCCSISRQTCCMEMQACLTSVARPSVAKRATLHPSPHSSLDES